jgi:hypothetical protein
VPPAEIAGFSPTSATAGTDIKITGTNFKGTTAVTFNSTAAVFTVNSPTQITAKVPAAASLGPIGLSTPGGSVQSAASFSPLPKVTGVSPPSGPAETTVRLTGSNFVGATAVKFDAANATFTLDSATQITAKVPVDATNGKVSVTTPAGTASTADSFTAAPVISGFTPTGGRVGTSVTINGFNFTGVTATSFNGTSASFVINSPTKITATVPAGATSGVIRVTSPAGTATSTNSFAVSP